MKRRISALLLALLAAAALGAPARADLLWAPRNDFYEKHWEDCDYLDRGFCANSPEGFVTLWDAPGGSRVQGQLSNGQELWVYWVYQDWAYADGSGEEEGAEGWVPLAELQLLYDAISFAQEYEDRIRDYSGEFADFTGDIAGVAFYEYPGAPEVEVYWALDQNAKLLENLTGGADQASYIQSIFVDEQGLTWGFVGYMYGRLNAWFCLDNPEGDGKQAEGESVFPLRDVGTLELYPAQPPRMPAAGYLPWVLVGAVALGTAALLTVFFRKKEKKQ